MDLSVRNKSSLFPGEQDDDPSVQPGVDPAQPPDCASEEFTRSYLDYTLFGIGDTNLFEKLDKTRQNIPRYLFRVIHPKSRCIAKQWASHPRVWSFDARFGKEGVSVDCFVREDKAQVARRLNQHLHGWKTEGDNFVSWTPSLLTTLAYVSRCKSSLGLQYNWSSIYLCVLDTTFCPPGTFIRDLDIIEAFAAYSTAEHDLLGLHALRSDGLHCFGDYLSQGALNMKGGAALFPVKILPNAGLALLRTDVDFHGPSQVHSPADELIRLREALQIDPLATTANERNAIRSIANLFMGPFQSGNGSILGCFGTARPQRRRTAKPPLRNLPACNGFEGTDKVPEHEEKPAPLPSKVIAHGMPELKEVQSFYFLLHLGALKYPDAPAQARASLKDARDSLSNLVDVPGGNWPLRVTYGNQMTAFLHSIGALKQQMEDMMRNASVED